VSEQVRAEDCRREEYIFCVSRLLTEAQFFLSSIVCAACVWKAREKGCETHTHTHTNKDDKNENLKPSY